MKNRTQRTRAAQTRKMANRTRTYRKPRGGAIAWRKWREGVRHMAPLGENPLDQLLKSVKALSAYAARRKNRESK